MKILIDSRHGIGDVVQTIPMINNIIKGNKVNNIEIYVIVQSDIHKEILEMTKLPLKFIMINFQKNKKIDIIKKIIFLRKIKFDFFIISPISNKKKSIYISKLINPRKTIIENYKETKKIINVVQNEKEHMIIRNNGLSKTLTSYEEYVTPYIEIENENTLQKFGLTYLRKKYLVFAIGTNELSFNVNGKIKKMDIKKWSLLRYIKLAEYLEEYKIIILGGQKEKKELDKYITSVGEIPINMTNLTGQTSIIETVKIISASKLIVGADTGLIHIAEALGVKIVALYGPTNHKRFGPLSSSNRIIQADNSQIKIEDLMDEIKVEEVLKNIGEII